MTGHERAGPTASPDGSINRYGSHRLPVWGAGNKRPHEHEAVPGTYRLTVGHVSLFYRLVENEIDIVRVRPNT